MGAILGFSILRHIERGIKLMLATRSMRALPTDTVPIKHGMITLPGSLNFCGRILWITKLQFPSTTMLSLLMYFPFFVRRSFRNLVYKGIYCRDSPKGIVIFSFLKMSRKRAKYCSFSFFEGTRGYGASFTGTYFSPLGPIDFWSQM